MEKIGTIFTNLHYDPITGHFTRDGKQAGFKSTRSGYRIVSLNNKQYLEHRLAWFYMLKCWPDEQIDHINGVRDDNRWINLRSVTNQQNQFNRGVRKDSRTGMKGVYPKGNRFRAAIWYEGKEKHLGYYSTPEEAKLAYDNFAKRIQGQYFREHQPNP